MATSSRSDLESADRDESGARRIGDHVAEVLGEPAYRAGLARARQIALIRRALREICGEYAAGCRPVQLREGRLRLEVPNSTALQFVNLNQRAVIARARRLGLADPIKEIQLVISPAIRPDGGPHGN